MRKQDEDKEEEESGTYNEFEGDDIGSGGVRYPARYKTPNNVSDQIDILRSEWPSISPDRAIKYCRDTYGKLEMPKGMEGPFAIIRPGFFSDKYYEELAEAQKALAKILKGKFAKEACNLKHFYRLSNTVEKLKKLMKQQPKSDILIVPAQFGFGYPGRSVRSIHETFSKDEFGLDSKDVSTMLLTHPSRIKDRKGLQILCAGDGLLSGGWTKGKMKWSTAANGMEGILCVDDEKDERGNHLLDSLEDYHKPMYHFVDGKIRFEFEDCNDASEEYGAVTATLAKVRK